MKIFIISDTHFNHLKLMEYENRPADFNEQIIRNWNQKVNDHDIVIHLGDIILGQQSELAGIMARLNGTKYLCRGNHDHEKSTWYLERGFDFVCDYFILDNIAYSHAPLTPLPLQNNRSKDYDWSERIVDLNIHGHFHRGKHRDKPGMPDRYYDHDYYDTNRDKYKLVQIEDTFSPILLDDLLKS